MKSIEEFLKSKTISSWIQLPQMVVYVYKAHHWINGDVRSTFDVANMVVDSNMRGKGIGTAFMKRLPPLLVTQFAGQSFDGIYVKNVLSENMHKMMKSLGYTHLPADCYYWDLKPRH